MDNHNYFSHDVSTKYHFFWKVNGKQPGGTSNFCFFHGVQRSEYISDDEIFPQDR